MDQILDVSTGMLNRQQSYKRIRGFEDKELTAIVAELCRSHVSRFPDDGPAWLHYGIVQIELAQYAEAEIAIRRSVALCPKEKLQIPSAQLGHLFLAKCNLKKAALWYQRALRRAPNDADYHIYLGHLASKQGLLSRAESYFRSAIKCSEGCIDEAYFNLGDTLLATRRYREAMACYRKALEIDPKYTIAKMGLKDARLALRLKKS